MSNSTSDANMHPFLKSSVLYVLAPQWVRQAQVHSVFARSGCGTVISAEQTASRGESHVWEVTFDNMRSAECALATLHGEVIALASSPSCKDIWDLQLSHSPDMSDPIPPYSSLPLPQFIKSSSKHIIDTLDAQSIFGFFRTAGPLAFVRTQVDVGYHKLVCAVQYFEEQDAAAADEKVLMMINTLNGGAARLQGYDPRSLFCANMSKDTTVEKLYKHFEEFSDDIVDVRVRSKKPDAPQFGFVVFRTETRAEDAMIQLNNTTLDGRKLSLQFSESGKNGLKPEKHPQLTFRLPIQRKAASDKPRGGAGSIGTHASTKTNATPKSKPAPPQKNRKQLQPSVHDSREAAIRRTLEADIVADDAGQRCNMFTSIEAHQQNLDDTLLRYQKTSDDLAAARRAREKAESREAALRAEQGRLQRSHKGYKRDVGTAKSEREATLNALKRAMERKKQAKAEEARLHRAWQAVAEKGEHEEESASSEDEIEESIRQLGALNIAEPEAEAGATKGCGLEEQEASAKGGVKSEEERDFHDEHSYAQRQGNTARETARAELVAKFGAKYKASLNTSNDRHTWSPSRALEWFRKVSDKFEAMRFSDEQPVTVQSVPWPTLLYPDDVRLESIEWAAVEAFFRSVKTLVTGGEYKVIVEKTHRRFHPDKWKSRGLLRTISDEGLRAKVEAAGNMVAQVVTPLWVASRMED